MTRIECLERVLVAATAVLDARTNQRLACGEWDALAAAVCAARSEESVVTQQPVRVVFEDGLILVWDAEGNGVDCHDLNAAAAVEAFAAVARHEAERQIDEWSARYEFDLADVKRRLADYMIKL